MTGHGRAATIRYRSGTVLLSVLLAACSSNPPPEPLAVEPEPAVEPTPVAPAPPEQAAPDFMDEALFALRDRNYSGAHDNLIEVLELCGQSPLGQQALLLVAAAELDPRNPSPRRSLASEATGLLLTDAATPSWARQLGESLYLLALRTGAKAPSLGDLESSELAGLYGGLRGLSSADIALYELMDENPTELARVDPGQGTGKSDAGARSEVNPDPRLRSGSASEYCSARWPDVWDRRPTDRLPSLGSSPYPAQVQALRARVLELEEELERIRRIVTQP